MKEKFFLATAIAYASQRPHIGNDFELIYSDAVARYKRLAGYDVFFLTGTDEHGQKVEEKAKHAGVTPGEYAAGITNYIMENYKSLNISYDKFIKTTDEYHVKAVSEIFKKLYEQGDLYKAEYEGPYCVPCESFYTKSQIFEEGVCPDCGAKLIQTKESAYFLKLSKYQNRLEKYIEETPDFIVPESRKREMLNNFIRPGLLDLCISRSSIKWGVPVEFDPGHVIYVWIDALSNYITALGYNPAGNDDSGLFDKYWPCDLHMIGKDILRFHTIYWPVILWALGLEQPKKILGHPWLLFGGDKMSKSKGNVVYTRDLISRFDTDAVRYYVLREMPYASDGCFTYENFITVYNSELVNTLSNLVNRTIVMAEKYFNGIVPSQDELLPVDEDLIDTARKTAESYFSYMDEYKISDAAEEIIKLLRRANKYIDETEPWVLGRDENKKSRLGTVLYNLLEAIRFGAVMLSPLIPETSEKIFAQLGTDISSFDSIKAFNGLNSGTRTGECRPLYHRLDEKTVLQDVFGQTSTEPDNKSVTAPTAEECSNEISIDDFMKTELRVALVLECEQVKKSDKLLLLRVDLGGETRQVVSGIAKFYKPDELVGKKVILVSNLKPVKLRGIMSEGMILASGEENVKVIFADDSASPGDRVR